MDINVAGSLLTAPNVADDELRKVEVAGAGSCVDCHPAKNERNRIDQRAAQVRPLRGDRPGPSPTSQLVPGGLRPGSRSAARRSPRGPLDIDHFAIGSGLVEHARYGPRAEPAPDSDVMYGLTRALRVFGHAAAGGSALAQP